jgi:hypothetical protein
VCKAEVGEVEEGRTQGVGTSLLGVGQDVTYFCVWSCALSALALVFILKVFLFPLALAEVMEPVEDRFRLVEVEETMDGN